MDIKVTAKYLKGRPNPWRVSMEMPTADGVETIHTRVDAKSEKAAIAHGWAIFLRVLARRGKGEGRMKLDKATG